MEALLSKENLQPSEREYFPRINFTSGFTRLTLLTASKKIGALMALVIFIKTSKGYKILSTQFKMEQAKQRNADIITADESSSDNDYSEDESNSNTVESKIEYN